MSLEAITYGDTYEEALERAPDALLGENIDAFMKDKRDIPAPSPIEGPYTLNFRRWKPQAELGRCANAMSTKAELVRG